MKKKEHARWLNTLSYLENVGARLIARSQHPTMVPREKLKHAAEEFRHAYFLKSLIVRVFPEGLPDYRSIFPEARHYLQRLNVRIFRWLKEIGRTELAYALVTYAIEMRALEIYTHYQEYLTQTRAPLSVRSVLREEEEHLAEILEELDAIEDGRELGAEACRIEATLFSTIEDRYCHPAKRAFDDEAEETVDNRTLARESAQDKT